MGFSHGKSFVSVLKHTGEKDCVMPTANRWCKWKGKEHFFLEQWRAVNTVSWYPKSLVRNKFSACLEFLALKTSLSPVLNWLHWSSSWWILFSSLCACSSGDPATPFPSTFSAVSRVVVSNACCSSGQRVYHFSSSSSVFTSNLFVRLSSRQPVDQSWL